MPQRLLLACALIGPLGCRSGTTGAQPAPTTDTATTEPTAVGGNAPKVEARRGSRPRMERGDACVPGSATIESAGLCLKLPDTYTAAAPLPGVQRFEAPGAPPIVVRWQPATRTFSKTHANAIGRMSALDSSALHGPTRDGSGSFVFAVETQALDHRVAHAASSVHIGDHVVWCAASAPVAADVPRAFFEACQSLMKSR